MQLGRFGFTEDRFWILRGLGGRRVRVAVDPTVLDAGPPLRLTVERRGRGIPLLTQLLGVIAAHRGAVAVHGSAFHLHGRGILVTGWAQAGKTESLLASLTPGASAIGDDLVLLDGPPAA